MTDKFKLLLKDYWPVFTGVTGAVVIILIAIWGVTTDIAVIKNDIEHINGSIKALQTDQGKIVDLLLSRPQ